MKIDQLLIKISGKAFIETQFELGDTLMVLMDGDIVKKDITDNQDGTVNVCYTFKPTMTEVKKRV